MLMISHDLDYRIAVPTGSEYFPFLYIIVTARYWV